MRRAAKVDSTARDLVSAARQMGAKVLILNGVIDVAILHRGKVHLVDFKTPQGKRKPRVTLTEAQARLLEEGWPIRLVSDLEGLKRILGATSRSGA